MFARFTERARQAIVLAQDEARALKHHYIGTEHILLGLLREKDGLAARALESIGISVEDVREQVRLIVGVGDEVTHGQIPFTPRTKKVLELALRESLELGHTYIGTEHILLGLVRENDGVAARILLEFDADASRIADVVTGMLGGGTTEGGGPASARASRQLPRWEYRVERWPAAELSTSRRLDELGAEGWQLAALDRDRGELQLIFQRLAGPQSGGRAAGTPDA